jgi:hypothetical protein
MERAVVLCAYCRMERMAPQRNHRKLVLVIQVLSPEHRSRSRFLHRDTPYTPKTAPSQTFLRVTSIETP